MADEKPAGTVKRGPGKPFEKGNNANPAGRPPGIGQYAEFRAACRDATLARLPVILERVDRELADPESACVMTRLMIEQGYGKAPQFVEVSSRQEESIEWDAIAQACGFTDTVTFLRRLTSAGAVSQ